MDKKTIFTKTAKGEHESAYLSSDLKRILSLIDNKSRSEELVKRAPPSMRSSWDDLLEELVAGGYIIDKDKPVVLPKITAPKMVVPKPAPSKMVTPAPTDDLDFASISPAAAASNAAALAAKRKADDAARARAELEASVAAAKARANAEAATKAEAKAKQEADLAARAKAEAELRAMQEPMVREQAEAKAKREAAAPTQIVPQTTRAAPIPDAAARVRAEIEAAARAQQVAEAKAKQEAEAERLKADQEAARIKAEQDAAARAKADAETARLRAEEAAARARAELEAARARAEAEAKALAEARARQAAEEKARQEAEAARLKAEQEAAAARLKAEQEAEAARLRAEAEAARLRAEAEAARLERIRLEQEAEAARLKAEQEAARLLAEAEAARLERIRLEQEAAAKVRAEAEAKAFAEAQARREAEAAAQREAEAKRIAEQAAAAQESTPEAAPAFEIQLDDFTGISAQPVTRGVATPAARAPLVPEETMAALAAAQRAQAEAAAKAKAEAEAAARAEAEKIKSRDIAAEMARLKEEADAARRKAEEEARRQAEERALAEEQSRAWAEADQRAKAQAAIEAEQAAQQAALAQAKEASKPASPRERRKGLPLGKIAFSLIVLALVAVVVLPYVYPLKDYISPLEQELSAQLKQPVHIGGMSATSLPPRLQLQNVTVGGAQEIKLGSVVLNFDPLSLLSAAKTVNNLELQDVSIQGRDLGKQTAGLKLLGANAHYPVRQVTLRRVKIVTDEIAVPSLSGVADVDAQGSFSRVALHSEDNKLGVDLQANQGRWQLSFNIQESSLPILPGIVFSDLSAKGDLSDGEVNFTEMNGHLYNGILLGSAKLNWQKDWQLQGHFEAKTFALAKMFPKYHVEGDLYGEGTFALNGAKLSQLGETPRLDGSFNVKNGTISSFDMAETARSSSRESPKGGRTNFDDMIGLVDLDNGTCRFSQLKIVSGTLSANGSFNVSSGDELGGKFNAEIKARAGTSLLTLYGSLAEPKLRAGR